MYNAIVDEDENHHEVFSSFGDQWTLALLQQIQCQIPRLGWAPIEWGKKQYSSALTSWDDFFIVIIFEKMWRQGIVSTSDFVCFVFSADLDHFNDGLKLVWNRCLW